MAVYTPTLCLFFGVKANPTTSLYGFYFLLFNLLPTLLFVLRSLVVRETLPSFPLPSLLRKKSVYRREHGYETPTSELKYLIFARP